MVEILLHVDLVIIATKKFIGQILVAWNKYSFYCIMYYLS